MAKERPHRADVRARVHPVLPAVRQGGKLRLRHEHGDAGVRAVRVDLRRRELGVANLAAARSALCGHSVFRRGRAVLSRPHEAVDVGVGTAHLSDPRHAHLYGVHPDRDDADLYAEQLYRQYVVGDGSDPRLFRRGQGSRAACARQDARDVASVPVRRDDFPPDAAVHARARAAYAVHEAPPWQERGRGCGVRLLALRAALKPAADQANVQPPGRADVQGKRRRGLAQPSESGDIPYAQFRLRPAAAFVADLRDLRRADPAADDRHPFGDPPL